MPNEVDAFREIVTGSLSDLASEAEQAIAQWRAENVEEITTLMTVRGTAIRDAQYNERTRELMLDTDAGQFVLGLSETAALSVIQIHSVAYIKAALHPSGDIEGLARMTVLGQRDNRAVIKVYSKDAEMMFLADPLETLCY